MTISLMGFGWDKSSSYARGAAAAPAIIRAHLSSEASSPYSLSGHDITKLITRENFAALPDEAAACRDEITARIAAELDAGNRPLSLGGDHSVTLPILKAMHAKHGGLNVLHIDAHPDMYDEMDGDRYSHACPFARALEAGYIDALVQVGIRSSSPDQRATGDKYGVTMLGAEGVGDVPFERLAGPVYISIDLDGLDPAFAPGVSHPEPGGLTTREVLGLIEGVPGEVVGADVVELNPERDVNMLTPGVAARLVKELGAKMVRERVS